VQAGAFLPGGKNLKSPVAFASYADVLTRSVVSIVHTNDSSFLH